MPFHYPRTTALTLLLSIAICAHAQRSFGGAPRGMHPSYPAAHVVTMPPVDVAALEAEDAQELTDGRKGPWRFGQAIPVAIDLIETATWHTDPDGTRIARLTISSPGAVSINLSFHTFQVPQGALVFLYNEAGDVSGGFDERSNPGSQVLGVAPMVGDRITIEYQEPAQLAGAGRLNIGSITHGYRLFKADRGFGDSDDCNINVICPQGDAWRAQIRSTVHIIGNAGVCTGTLMNNCAEDSTPYFLTAKHCKPAGENPATWVFRFNWDSPSCTPTEQGPMDQTISGADELVENIGTDMLFLRLSSVPPTSFNAYYSGWDKSGVAPTRTTGIHHPSGDIKKISHSEMAATEADGMNMGSGAADCWHVPVWTEGTTEPGSSGSGLWNQHKQLIGQLYGGAASCANSVDDYYGRLSVSWSLLEPWLGSCGDTLGGYDPQEEPILVRDAMVTSITGVPLTSCGVDSVTPVVTLRNNGDEVLHTVTLEYFVNGTLQGATTWNGQLLPVQTANIQLPPIAIPTGMVRLKVRSRMPNNLYDFVPANDADSIQVVANHPATIFTLQLVPDNYGSDITWTLAPVNGPVIASGGPYTNNNTTPIIQEFCLGNACYLFSIADAFGDGICCGEGQGHYSITSIMGPHVTSDGNYGSGEQTQFCMATASVPGLHAEAAPLHLYPNPGTGAFMLSTDGIATGAPWILLDATGRTAAQGRILRSGGEEVLDLQHLGVGMYLLRLEGDRGVRTARIVIAR